MQDITTEALVQELLKRTTDVAGAAVYLDTHPSYVRRIAPRLSPHRIGRHWLFELSVLEVERKRRLDRADKIRLRKLVSIAVPAGYNGWTVKELKAELKYRGCKVKRKKVVLMARLEESDGPPVTDSIML